MNEHERLWHVTVTLCGEPHDADLVREALERLQNQVGFLHSLLYAPSTAELQYWEEADSMLDAAALALRFWAEHRGVCGLAEWQVVGLEVLERVTFQRRSV
ncbi:MAG: hypothetical protein GEU93_20945, partial [Propionibacteriales bacterium]|nr:hypothetical protein [Propionibacteriales bacterium]